MFFSSKDDFLSLGYSFNFLHCGERLERSVFFIERARDWCVRKFLKNTGYSSFCSASPAYAYSFLVVMMMMKRERERKLFCSTYTALSCCQINSYSYNYTWYVWLILSPCSLVRKSFATLSYSATCIWTKNSNLSKASLLKSLKKIEKKKKIFFNYFNAAWCVVTQADGGDL